MGQLTISYKLEPKPEAIELDRRFSDLDKRVKNIDGSTKMDELEASISQYLDDVSRGLSHFYWEDWHVISGGIQSMVYRFRDKKPETLLYERVNHLLFKEHFNFSNTVTRVPLCEEIPEEKLEAIVKAVRKVIKS